MVDETRPATRIEPQESEPEVVRTQDIPAIEPTEAEQVDVSEPDIEVFSIQDGKFLNIPESSFEEGIKDRRFTVRQGERIPVQAPDGSFGTIASEEIFQALDSGYKYDPSAQRLDRELEAKFGNQPIRAGLESFGSSLSFGINDQIMVKLGLADADDLRERRERNELASGIGNVSGIVIPLLMTGGATGAAKGIAQAIKLSGSGVRAASRVGKAAEKLTEQVLKKAIKDTGSKEFAKNLARKAIPASAGAATEGIFYSTGQLISEDALGNREFNAENLIADASMGALLGGSVGGVFGGLRATAPIVKKGVAKTGALLKPVKEKIDNVIQKATSKQEAALDLMGIKGAARDKLESARPELVNELPEWLHSKVLDKALGGNQELLSKLGKIREAAGSSIKKIANDIDEILNDVPQALPDNASVADRVIKRLDEIIESGIDDPARNLELNGVRRLRKEWIKQRNSQVRINAKELWKRKKSAGDAGWKGTKQFKSTGDATVGTTVEGHRAVYSELAKIIQEMAETASKIDPNKAGTLLDDLLVANKDFSYAETLHGFLKKKVGREKLLGFSDYMGGLLSVGTGSPEVLAAVGVKKFLESDIKNRLLIMSSIEKQSNKMRDLASKAAKVLVNGNAKAKKALNKIKAPVSTDVLLETSLNPKHRKRKETKAQAFERVRREINERVTNIDHTQEMMELRSVRLAQAAPKTAASAQSAAMRGLMYLHSQLPEDHRTNVGLKPRSRQPSSIEISKFERTYNAVMNPLSVFKDFANDNINREGAEVLREVYPEMYAELQNAVLDEVELREDDLPYRKKLELGTILNIDTDASLQADNISGLQSQFLSEEEKENIQVQQRAKETGVINTTVTGLKQLDKASRASTPLNKVIDR